MSAVLSGAAFSVGESKMKKCTVEWSNVWTSKGKYFAGDEVELPEDEAAELKASGAVSVKRSQKKVESE